MKNWIKIFALTAFSTQIYAQQNFTIDDAVKYALENNVNVKKAKIDQTIAQQKVKETVGIGLPQVNAQGKYNDFIKVGAQLFPAELIPEKYLPPELQGKDLSGQFIPLAFGQKYNMQGGVTVSQLLFNGSYIVGLESSRTYKQTAALVEQKTEISIKEAVMMTYAGILSTDENIKTLEENKRILEKNLNDTKATYKAGLIELQNVEQLEYSYKNLSTVINNLKRTRTKLLIGFKYLMGYPTEQELTLTSTFDDILEKNKILISKDGADLSNHIDLQLKQNQIKINELLLKLEKSKALPSLATFLSSNSVANSNDFGKLFSEKFYNSTIFGVQLDVPIFSGLQRHWRTEQAKLELSKAQLDKEDTEKQLKSELIQKSTDYENALASFETSEDLVKLSSEIYRKQNIKFTEGLGTSFELSQAESQLYDAQTNYYQAAIQLIQAKISLDKAKGTL